MQVIGVSYLFFIITQNREIFKVKNVLKIEKNEELNYEFDKQNPTSTKLVGFFVGALRHFILSARKGDGRQCLPGRQVYFINNRGEQVRLRYFYLLLYPR